MAVAKTQPLAWKQRHFPVRVTGGGFHSSQAARAFGDLDKDTGCVSAQQQAWGDIYRHDLPITRQLLLAASLCAACRTCRHRSRVSSPPTAAVKPRNDAQPCLSHLYRDAFRQQHHQRADGFQGFSCWLLCLSVIKLR